MAALLLVHAGSDRFSFWFVPDGTDSPSVHAGSDRVVDMETALVPWEKIERAAERFRLLGEPARLMLLNLLNTQGEMNVQELVEASGQSHANVSKHLRLPAESGMVRRRKEGLYAYYAIDDPSLSGICLLVCSQLSKSDG